MINSNGGEYSGTVVGRRVCSSGFKAEIQNENIYNLYDSNNCVNLSVNVGNSYKIIWRLDDPSNLSILIKGPDGNNIMVISGKKKLNFVLNEGESSEYYKINYKIDDYDINVKNLDEIFIKNVYTYRYQLSDMLSEQLGYTIVSSKKYTKVDSTFINDFNEYCILLDQEKNKAIQTRSMKKKFANDEVNITTIDTAKNVATMLSKNSKYEIEGGTEKITWECLALNRIDIKIECDESLYLVIQQLSLCVHLSVVRSNKSFSEYLLSRRSIQLDPGICLNKDFMSKIFTKSKSFTASESGTRERTGDTIFEEMINEKVGDSPNKRNTQYKYDILNQEFIDDFLSKISVIKHEDLIEPVIEENQSEPFNVKQWLIIGGIFLFILIFGILLINLSKLLDNQENINATNDNEMNDNE